MLVETTLPGSSGDVGLVAGGGTIQQATTKLEESLGSVRGAAVALLSTVHDVRGQGEITIDEITLDLALSFGVEGGVVVAKGSAQAEASISLTWRARPAPPLLQ
jgi:hypothetical protein